MFIRGILCIGGGTHESQGLISLTFCISDPSVYDLALYIDLLLPVTLFGLNQVLAYRLQAFHVLSRLRDVSAPGSTETAGKNGYGFGLREAVPGKLRRPHGQSRRL